MHLSGTQFASLLPVGKLAPGMLFADATTSEYSQVTVGTYFIDVEWLLIIDRLRWDSPRLAGLRLSGSIAADSRWDTTVRAKYAPRGFIVVGGATYQNEPFTGIERRYDAVVSMRHEATGLNSTLGGTNDRVDRGATARSWNLKLGWWADLLPLDKTAFSADWYGITDLRVDGDSGTSYGIFAVRKWPAYGLDFYVGMRHFEVTGGSFDLEPLLIVPFGVVFNFREPGWMA